MSQTAQVEPLVSGARSSAPQRAARHHPPLFKGQLLRASQVRQILAVAPATFYGQKRRATVGLLPRLIASGLEVVCLPSPTPGKAPLKRYTASSLRRLIRAAAETGRPLGT